MDIAQFIGGKQFRAMNFGLAVAKATIGFDAHFHNRQNCYDVHDSGIKSSSTSSATSLFVKRQVRSESNELSVQSK